VPTIHQRSHGNVAELTLNRPEALNAINTELARDLIAALDAVREDPSVRAVVLSAAGDKAFCVGADLKERTGFTDADLLAQRLVFRRLFGSVIDLPVPAVAAVAGHALGGGFEMALGCDLIVAGDGATFGLPEVSVGLVPGGGGTQLLGRRVGAARAADLILTGRRVALDEAVALGLVDRRVAGPDTGADTGPDAVREAALELAARIAANSPIAVRNAKHALRTGLDLPLAAGLDIEDGAWRAAAFSADRVEGIRAFVDKRPPAWPS
jgi:enoyl-CoA hydratase/carnithine racemase